ncbi:hypothetical protein DPMN_107722 [Dreissena polymorpha]|uniref:Uncharacterized protein n=1 Tax=Dreissena polymorpha TaxID=45954 RepID=A0A9D4K7B0_DREPO|nr:hypothetical protein DPMN_107722 [Dreissena polymorpha]
MVIFRFIFQALSTVNTVVCNNFVLSDAYNGVSDGVQRQLLIEVVWLCCDIANAYI